MGIITGFLAVLGGIKAILAFAALGAGAGVVAALGSRLIGGVQGYVAAAVIGAVIVIGSNGSTYFTSIRDRNTEAQINILKNENARLSQRVEAEILLNKVQTNIVTKQQEVLEKNNIALGKLEDVLKKHKDDPACVLHPDELELLNEIQ